jgi:hypothetical protein
MTEATLAAAASDALPAPASSTTGSSLVGP